MEEAQAPLVMAYVVSEPGSYSPIVVFGAISSMPVEQHGEAIRFAVSPDVVRVVIDSLRTIGPRPWKPLEAFHAGGQAMNYVCGLLAEKYATDCRGVVSEADLHVVYPATSEFCQMLLQFRHKDEDDA